MSLHRCQWCGRFFASALPEPLGCPDHTREANEALRLSILRHNAKLQLAEVERSGT